MNILGISAFYHDSAAAVVRDGEVVAAAQEERFTRLKHDSGFPRESVRWCLEEAAVEPDGIDLVAYYEKPLTSFARVVRSSAGAGSAGLLALPGILAEWGSTKLWTGHMIEKGISDLGWKVPSPIFYAEHHQSHAASAFFPSPFESAAVLTFDGVGEWATSSIGHGSGSRLDLLSELRFPHSLGLLYSSFTFHAGFRVNSGEYKLMGLAPFGEPRYVDRIFDHLVSLNRDGSFTLNQKYFSYLGGRRMTSKRFDDLFDGPARAPEGPITRRDADLARSVQEVVEQIVLAMAWHAHRTTGESRACLSGGVALNCVSNARLLREGPFEEIWIQPAAGDAGSAVGCALAAWYSSSNGPRTPSKPDAMSASLLGPSFAPGDIASLGWKAGWDFDQIPNPDERFEQVAGLIEAGATVGLFQGAMEFGPRALGSRSIVADPRLVNMQTDLNRKIKFRESFRPFAPAVLEEEADRWFDLEFPSPYMLLVAQVLGWSGPGSSQLSPVQTDPAQELDLAASLADISSPLPAVTHVDGSARVQTVGTAASPGFRCLLEAFNRLTGCPVLVNTSFNVRGEPIVGSPLDAYRCFMTTGLDYLLIEDCLFDKHAQPPWQGPGTLVAHD